MIRRVFLWLAFAAALGAVYGAWRLDRWIETTDIPPLILETGVTVLDRDGDLLRAYTVEDGRWRLPLSLEAVDPGFIEMLIAYEDRRFYDHAGVDPRAFVRAAWQALTSGRIVSGGSTLTMQVARLLEDSGTGAMEGKIRQIRLALALERQLSKDEILTLYLHLAPYGGNIEGIRAASLTWFGTEPRRLTAAQSALLVALPQAPTSRRPDRFPEAALVARNRVLSRAVRFTELTEAQIDWARAAPIPTERRAFPALAAHLADRMLIDRPTQGTHHLTLDADLQARMEALAERAVQGLSPQMGAAIMVMDHQTGALLASVGAPDYTDTARSGFVDMTQAVRSPGSALKPLIYALGFDDGLIHPQTRITDRPVDFDGYQPQNFDGIFRGEVSVSQALQASLNIPAVTLLNEIGPARLLSAMRRSGMAMELPEGEDSAGLAIALGGIGTRMEDLMQLYAALARGGQAAPFHVRRGEAPLAGQRVVGPLASWYLTQVLAEVPPPPTASRSRLAYKTGTSYGHRDAWAFGYDGRHVIGVWMGRADGASVPGAFGAELSAPILFEAFSQLDGPRVPYAAPPEGALTLRHSDLPQPLQRFGSDLAEAEAGPDITFPPPGAVLAYQPGLPLIARVADGTPPFTWLWNGAPIETQSFDTQVVLDDPGLGFGELTVIDAMGRAERRSLEIAAE